ncbi:M20/M25/M40 family metallo-hydrolase [Phaeocystidibacter marisrubri]|uniref:M20 family metallo-hydrolase n=1 Tax=Phaeocystidibacter marisrubri TaxID=1577780 RepID=A0A6L3ZKV0_9FLAO|nr:M20/M25/M40 family metallo-hydrolase [Phaeocystidibacter marisrubri]KAB2818095.1 M20 family metallo-hydrolase [Phaeocystidibacter marisrubri]GGH71975.1 acetylornithine deacetylase [Phaeocystidibacter marisrubri]
MMAHSALEMLENLIRIPSFSGEEDRTADYLASQFEVRGIPYERSINNVWAFNKHFDAAKPSILLNSHHDTVKPNSGYTRDPFTPEVENGKLYGLGSNDAGGALIAMFHAFVHFYEREGMSHNLIYLAVGEEETSSLNGAIHALEKMPPISFGLVGEPTEMNLAIAEKGLIVIDAEAMGVPGHAAHTNTVNPIYKIAKDIAWVEQFTFEKASEVTGPVRMSVTQVQAGKQSNLVPAKASFVMDVRVPDVYELEEVFAIIDAHTESVLTARSFRMRPSSIPADHPIVLGGIALGRKTYGSPTLSDQAHMRFPTLKIGPGKSERSHTADEFIYVDELEKGIEIYIDLLKTVL